MMDSPVSGGTQAGLAAAPELRPVWVGSAPPLAEGFTARAETGQLTQTVLGPGTALGARPRACRRTAQLAGRDRQDAARAVIRAFAVAGRGGRPGDLADRDEPGAGALRLRRGRGRAGHPTVRRSRVGVRPLPGRLRDTPRPWLVVIDDLTDPMAIQGLWPRGPSGRVLITTSDPVTLSGYPAHVMPVGAFSRREALTYLVGRLTTDLDQRQGAIDLVGDLGNEPLALALASAVIASSELTCHDYREHFLRRREQALGPPRWPWPSRRPPRSPGRCPWTTPTCCRPAPLIHCPRSPRCLTATEPRARSSPPPPCASNPASAGAHAGDRRAGEPG